MDIYEIRNALNAGKTMFDLPLRVTYYARVSTDKDEQLHSLSAQVQYYAGFIARCPNWTFVDGYVDEGISGTVANKRENFMRMIRDAGENRFDFIVTKEISRFSRNTLDSIRYTQELLKCGVGVLFQSDNINTLLPDAELRLTILSSIAQDEVRKISERVKFGFKRAIEKGTVLGNSRIWGYQKQNGRLVVREEEAEIVRLIFDLYANQQMGIRTIAGYLMEHGYTNTRGNALSFSTIHGILTNPKYKGYYCGGKSSKIDYKLHITKNFPPEDWVMYPDEEHVPPIVSEALWEKANRTLAARAAKRSAADRSSGQNRYPYSGKILCGVHRVPYYRSLYRYPSGDREVWQCREYARKGRSGCTSPALYTAELDDLLRQALEQLPFQRNTVAEELIRIYTSAGGADKTEAELARTEASMDVLRRRKDKLLDLSIDGRISDEELTRRNARFNEELEQLRQTLQALREEQRRTRDRVNSLASLREAITRELNFEQGFSGGVVDALVHHLEVEETDRRDLVQVKLYLNLREGAWRYQIRRSRGKPSVCSGPYI